MQSPTPCYAVFQGSSTLLLGKSPLDRDVAGIEIKLGKGDIIVLPVSHIHSSDRDSD